MNVLAQKNREEIIPTRQSLLERLKDLDDSQSWREFFELYWRLIYNVARKAGLSDVEAQEVVQETVVAVSRYIGQFEVNPGRGSFKGWLLKMSRWRILDQINRRNISIKHFKSPAEPPGSSLQTPTVHRIPDPRGDALAEVWDEEWKSNLLETAMEQVKARVDPKHFQVFYFYVVKEQPVQTVSRMFGVGRGQIYLIKHRVLSLIKRQVKLLESHLC